MVAGCYLHLLNSSQVISICHQLNSPSVAVPVILDTEQTLGCFIISSSMALPQFLHIEILLITLLTLLHLKTQFGHYVVRR